MAMTRDEFVSEICDVVGKKQSATAPSGSLLKDRVGNIYLNWAQKRIAAFYSFEELNVTSTSASTAASVKTYPLTTGDNALGLTRVKDINTIRLIDSENSTKLDRWSERKFDKHYPRPENFSTGRPSIYLRWGKSIELFKIPDATYSLYIRYSQWPQNFTSGGQVSDFDDRDQLIVVAGIFETYLALEEYTDARIYWERFKGLLTDTVRAEGDVDWEPEAEPGDNDSYKSGTPWTDPFGTAADPLAGME